MGSKWTDNPARFGLVSRLLHWGMAAIFAWQFIGMILLAALGETPFTLFFIGTHATLGVLLFLLVALRLAWGVKNARRRPSHGFSFSGKIARVGHAALYGLMLLVPVLALLRSYGSGRAFAPLGIPFWGSSEDKISWMVIAGDAAHGLLAWGLLALIVGHAGIAIWHRVANRDDLWQRMV
ncbi:cytochrome b [Pseudomonas aeruginosa]|uniref:cytochrome b n=1 Tax=Pseudomonas aeruginosa TaxID=287 RepID=UPI00155915C0|nr:cytochrome b/b6 domain-containing protein [Pseudomonas aeruginosa]NPW37130.1 cytochrome b [Pseudomonas aeruginosa]